MSIQLHKQQWSHTSQSSQHDTKCSTLTPLESAPPRPWRTSSSPPYIPRQQFMTSPTSYLPTPNTKPTAQPVKLPKPTKPDLTKVEPEANPEEQAQRVDSLVKDML